MNEVSLNNSNFESVVMQAKVPVLVDFWAEWCGPCKVLSPILEEISKELPDKFILAKVNVDEDPELASKFNIMSIPTMKFFKEGKIVNELIGAAPKSTIVSTLESLF